MRCRFASLAPLLWVGAQGCGNVHQSDQRPVHVVDVDGSATETAPEPPPDSGGAGDAGGAAGPDAATQVAAGGCPDLFTQDRLRRYELDISPSVWAQIQAEFLAGPPAGTGNKPYYPIDSFRYEGEVRTDASLRLKGDSSWRFTVMMDANPKAQFVIAFGKGSAAAPDFHGVDKINFDMPQSDLTMMHERLAYAFERAAGLPAPCANNAELVINGQVYGLYVSKEQYGGHLMERLFPGRSGGVLLKAGFQIEDNAGAYDAARAGALWSAYDTAAMVPLVDMGDSLKTWAAEMMINDFDGYWGGNHNFYIYDHPDLGFLWLTDDADASFEWQPMMQHPLYWWLGRSYVPDSIPQHYVAVLADDHWRGELVQAMRDVSSRWDVAEIQSWIDAWGPQIVDAVGRDPHIPFSVADHANALASARAEVAQRADYVNGFLACYGGSGAGATDADGDGYPWCKDCNDGSAAIHGVADSGCVP
jgi:hypothetical protein